MEMNVDKHYFLHWIVAVQGLVMESLHVYVQVLPWALAYMTEFDEGELGLNIEELSTENGQEVLPIVH